MQIWTRVAGCAAVEPLGVCDAGRALATSACVRFASVTAGIGAVMIPKRHILRDCLSTFPAALWGVGLPDLLELLQIFRW